MRTHLALLGLLSLGCGGMFVSQEDRQQLTDIVTQALPGRAVPFFVQGGADIGMVNPACARCLQNIPKVSPEIRTSLAATALTHVSCMCPSTCASDRLDAIAKLPHAERMEQITVACEPEGPDPVFRGDQVTLANAADPIDYALVRMMAEAFGDTDELAQMRPALAVGLAMRGGERSPPTDTLTVTGHDPKVFLKNAGSLTACKEGLSHRLVVDPKGAIVAVDPPTCEDTLKALRLRRGPWRVVDVAWSKDGIAAHAERAKTR